MPNPSSGATTLRPCTGVFAVAGLAMFIDGITAYPSALFNLMTGVAAVLMVAVIWLAVKWSKRQA
jgi:hypothetical protein